MDDSRVLTWDRSRRIDALVHVDLLSPKVPKSLTCESRLRDVMTCPSVCTQSCPPRQSELRHVILVVHLEDHAAVRTVQADLELDRHFPHNSAIQQLNQWLS